MSKIFSLIIICLIVAAGAVYYFTTQSTPDQIKVGPSMIEALKVCYFTTI